MTIGKAVLPVVALLLLAALAEGLVYLRWPYQPLRIGGVLVALSLLLGAFVGLTDARFVAQLRRWALRSWFVALALPLLLLVPYCIYAWPTATFCWGALFKLACYVLVPVALLLPDRLRRSEHATWRDFAALAALAVPIPAHWLAGIWTWPQELYFFQPLIAVCVGGYAFMAVRSLRDVGYKLLWRKRDVIDGLANLAAFALLGIPLGYRLHFIRFHPAATPLKTFAAQFVGIYLTVAIPEELVFRGILQNLLVKSLTGERRGPYGLLIASTLFGAAHLHHPPVPNWRYAIMATLAGVFYGNAYRTRQRICASALTHALVDTLWRLWF
jgi:membrane protease YdiL (CAAX protease family)